jgi:transmembrane sensor
MSDNSVQSAIAQEALDWFVRNRGTLSAEERASFGNWLKLSPMHVEHYLRVAVVSQSLRAAVGAMEVDIDALIAQAGAGDHDGQRPIWSRKQLPYWTSRLGVTTTAIAAGVALLVLGGIVAIWLARERTRNEVQVSFSTHQGEQRSWDLPDGSLVSLNPGSNVIVHYSNRERLVTIDSGRVFFRVHHEPNRRFRVVAGAGGLIAVGTEFEVLRGVDSTVVTVVQGKVAVFAGDAAPATATATLPPQSVPVSAGEQAVLDDRGQSARPKVTEVDVHRVVNSLRYQFDRQPLGVVVKEFSRYSDLPILIQSDRLHNLLISGVFDEFDTDSFLAFLSQLDDVRIERSAERILILDKSE